VLAERFGPEFSVADLVGMDNYTAAVRTGADGAVQRPFTLLSDPLPPERSAAWMRMVRRRAQRPPAPDVPATTVRVIEPEDVEPLEVEWTAG
jgi:hypothetical protein